MRKGKRQKKRGETRKLIRELRDLENAELHRRFNADGGVKMSEDRFWIYRDEYERRDLGLPLE